MIITARLILTFTLKFYYGDVLFCPPERSPFPHNVTTQNDLCPHNMSNTNTHTQHTQLKLGIDYVLGETRRIKFTLRLNG